MIHSIEICNTDVYKSVERETSQNFRAIRTSQGSESNIDANYADMVVMPEDDCALYEQLQLIIPSIYQEIKGYTTEFFVSDTKYGFTVEAQDENASAILKPLFEKIVAYNLLAWWYNLRMPELAQQYLAMSAEILSAIKSVVIPRFGTRKLRMI